MLNVQTLFDGHVMIIQEALSEKAGRADYITKTIPNVRKFVVSNSLFTDPHDGYSFESIAGGGWAIKTKGKYFLAA